MYTIVQCDYMLLFEKLYVGGKIEKNLGLRGKLTDSFVCVASGTLLHLSYACVGDRGSVPRNDSEQGKCSLVGALCCPGHSVLLWRCTSSVFSEDCLPRRARSSVHSVCCVWWVLHTRQFTCLGATDDLKFCFSPESVLFVQPKWLSARVGDWPGDRFSRFLSTHTLLFLGGLHSPCEGNTCRGLMLIPTDGQSRWLSDCSNTVLFEPPGAWCAVLRVARYCLNDYSGPLADVCWLAVLLCQFRRDTWLILPVVICLSQRLSHACLSTSLIKVKPRMAH